MQTIKMANHAAVWNNNIYNYEHAEDNLRMLFCLKGCPKGQILRAPLDDGRRSPGL